MRAGSAQIKGARLDRTAVAVPKQRQTHGDTVADRCTAQSSDRRFSGVRGIHVHCAQPVSASLRDKET